MQPIDREIVLAQITSLTEETESMQKSLQGNPPTEKALSDLSDKIIGLVKSVLQEPSLSEDSSIKSSLFNLKGKYSIMTDRRLSPEVEAKALCITENIRALVTKHFPSQARDADWKDPSTWPVPKPSSGALEKAVGAREETKETHSSPKAARVLSPEEIQSLLDEINKGTPVLGLVTTNTMKNLLETRGESIICLNLDGLEITPGRLQTVLMRCPNIKMLKLQHCSITDETVEVLAKHPTTKMIVGLDLSDNQITTRGARELTKALNRMDPKSPIKGLGLSNNLIPPKTQEAIYDSLKKNLPDLTLLTDIHKEEAPPPLENPSKIIGSIPLTAEEQIKRINTKRPIKEDGLTEVSLIDLLKSQGEQITSLNLSDIPLSRDGLQSILTLCPNLKFLIANNCSISDELATILARHPTTKNISKLNLRENQITDVGAERLAAMIEGSQLKTISLYNNQISRDLTSGELYLLRSLNAKTPAKDLGLTEESLITLLKTYSRRFDGLTIGSILGSLDLSGMPLSEEGLRSILTLCPNLEYLKAQNCGITDIGAKAIAKALKNNHLEEIDLSGNDITDKGAAVISKKIPEKTELRKLTLNQTLINKDMMRLMINKHKTVDFSAPTSEADKLSQFIALLETSGNEIQTLDLSDMKLSASGMQHILTLCPNIKELTAGNCRIDDDLATLIATHPNGKNISLLDLSGNKITDRGTTAIALHMPKVETLLLGNNQIGNAGAEEIALGMPNVKFLNLSGNKIGDVGAEHLARVLERFTLTLDLSDNKIGDVGARALKSKITKMHSTIEFLDLSKNEISPSTIDLIGDIVDLNKKVRSFDG